VTTPVCGVMDGAVVWVQKLGSVIWDLTVNGNAREGIAFDNVNWLVIISFHIIIAIMCAEGGVVRNT